MYKITLTVENVSGDLFGFKEILSMVADEHSDVLFVDVEKVNEEGV